MKKTSWRAVLAAPLALAALASPPAMACGSDPYIGAVCTFGFNFCPRGWAEASGQLLSIAQNQALFSLLGTNYGGDGRTTFALPDLRGRVIVHAGFSAGPGLSQVQIGERGGQESVSLTQAQMPAHTHSAQVKGTATNGNTDNPTGAVPARLPRSNIYSSSGASDATMATTVTIGTAGGGQPVSVRDPYLGMTTCIALVGIYPSRD